MKSIYDQDHCIFCLDVLDKDLMEVSILPNLPFKRSRTFDYHLESDELIQLIDKISELSRCKHLIENESIELCCKHVYHLGCFMSYLKSIYTKYLQNDFECAIFIECPLCRKDVSKKQTLDILDKYKDLNSLNENTNSLVEKLKSKIFYKKLIMFSKKIIGRDNLYDLYEYNKLNMLYDEIDDIRVQIKRNIVDTVYIKNDLDKFVFNV